MTYKFLKFTFTVLLCFVSTVTLAQTQIFTDQANPTLSMPSLVGWHGGLGAQTHYNRTSVSSASAINQSYSVGADMYIDKLRSGFAISLAHERYAVLSDNYLQLHWSPKLTLGAETYLSPGFSLQYMQRALDFDQLDPKSAIQSNVNLIGLGGGLSFIHKGWLFSGNTGFINRPNTSFFENVESRMSRVYLFYVMRRFNINERLSLSPMAKYHVAFGDDGFLTVGANAAYRWLSVSGSVNTYNEWAAAIAYEFKKSVRLAYSYRSNRVTNSFSPFSSHEIGIRTLLFRGQAKKEFLEDLPLF